MLALVLVPWMLVPGAACIPLPRRRCGCRRMEKRGVGRFALAESQGHPVCMYIRVRAEPPERIMETLGCGWCGVGIVRRLRVQTAPAKALALAARMLRLTVLNQGVRSWAILGDPGPSWAILGHPGPSWAILGHPSCFNRQNPASIDTLSGVSFEAGFGRLKLEIQIPNPKA